MCIYLKRLHYEKKINQLHIVTVPCAWVTATNFLATFEGRATDYSLTSWLEHPYLGGRRLDGRFERAGDHSS